LGLGLDLLKPLDDRTPVLRFGVVEGRVVRAGWKDEQIGAAAGATVQFVSHLQLEEPVAVALDDEDGKGRVAQGFSG